MEIYPIISRKRQALAIAFDFSAKKPGSMEDWGTEFPQHWYKDVAWIC